MVISIEMKSLHDIVMLDAIVDLWKSKWKADEAEEAEEKEDDEEDDDTVSDCDSDDEEKAREEIRRIFRACGFVWPDRDDRSDDHRRKPRR